MRFFFQGCGFRGLFNFWVYIFCYAVLIVFRMRRPRVCMHNQGSLTLRKPFMCEVERHRFWDFWLRVWVAGAGSLGV